MKQKDFLIELKDYIFNQMQYIYLLMILYFAKPFINTT